MNAQEQQKYINTEYNNAVAKAYNVGISTRQNRRDEIVRNMVSEINHRIQKYGDKAFPLSDKQMALFDEFVADYTAQAAEKQSADYDQMEAAANAVLVTISPDAADVPGAWLLARQVAEGRISLFDAKVGFAELRMREAIDEAWQDIYGSNWSEIRATRQTQYLVRAGLL